MTYRETARRYVAAELSTRHGSAPDPATLGAAKLPMSEWAEIRRADMTPATIAQNHAMHVEATAQELREAIAAEHGYGSDVAIAARALLAAIGEGEA